MSQGARLLSLVQAVSRECRRIVVCGDFNVLPESALFRLFQSNQLEDLVCKNGHHDTRTSFYSKRPRYADYMMVSPEIKVVRFEVPVTPEVSDHRPLILDFD